MPANNWGKETPVVGNDVSIGCDVTIYSGVKIGDGAVISRSFRCTKTVPPFAVVAGNPTKVVKFRFTGNNRKVVEASLVADLPLDTIRQKLIPFVEDIDKFVVALEEERSEQGS